MPFTLDGQWIPSKQDKDPGKKPVKVRLVKRKQSVITTILNLNLSEDKLSDLASLIKKKLGCGGAVKNKEIEIQGDKVLPIQKILDEQGIKHS